MRILLLSNYFPPDSVGGLELSAFEAAAGLASRGHEIEVLTAKWRTKPKAELEAFLVRRELTYTFPSQYYGRRLRSLPWRIRDISKMRRIGPENLKIAEAIAKEGRHDVVFAWGFTGIGAPLVLPFAERGVPVVWQVGDMNLRERVHPHGINQALYALFGGEFGRLDARLPLKHILANSQFTKRKFVERGFDPGAIDVIYRGIDPARIFDDPAPKVGDPYLMMACRVTVQKGVEVALRAMALMPDVRLKIAGPGEEAYVRSVKALAKELGVAGRVDFLGQTPRETVFELMRGASVVLSASLIEEYFGRVNIEAMACCVPLLASNTENIREIGKDGEELVVYEQNDPADLAAKARNLLNNPERAEKIARAGAKRARNAFSQTEIDRQIEAYLLKVLPTS